ncbi:MAG: thioredoxin [Succinivibrionaceae bacterium]
MSEFVKEINDAEFDEIVLNNEKPVLVDFWAPWCGPCRMLAPIIEDLAKDVQNIHFVKINIDESKDNATKFRIRNIPSLLLFKNGELVAKQEGALNKNKLKEFIEQALN